MNDSKYLLPVHSQQSLLVRCLLAGRAKAEKKRERKEEIREKREREKHAEREG